MITLELTNAADGDVEFRLHDDATGLYAHASITAKLADTVTAREVAAPIARELANALRWLQMSEAERETEMARFKTLQGP